ncbi:hypothetical protein C8A01DRAFT_39800, partial [Parachaetomium inaequale]
MVAFSRSLAAAGWLLAGAAAVAHERFVAVETGAVLSPRQYKMSPAHPLAKREGACDAGWHPCNEIGPPGETLCCPNTHYCIVDPTNITHGGCCHIGLECGSPCAASQYQCAITDTLTTSGTTTTSLREACCPRHCTGTSEFQCAQTLGGGCCQYGNRCATNSQCLFTPPPTTSINPSLIAPPGCETGQISCAASLGGGCCAASQSCTLIDATAHCADDPITPTGSGVSVVQAPQTGLSAGATAGVAVGVVVGAGVILGV